jgi:D-glycerate 3-kinase
MPEPPSGKPLGSILSAWITEQSISIELQQQLEAMLLADRRQAKAFGITPDNVSAIVDQRLHQVRSIYPTLCSTCRDQLGWATCPLDWLWTLWLPLATLIAHWHEEQGNTLIQGILGGQGTGKSTLALILAHILNRLGRQVCRLSLDDLYNPYADRLQLQQHDPRFRWRGPPGTHDVDLGLMTLQQLRQADAHQPVQVPRFDKSAQNGAGDRTQPDWVSGVDIVLFEGWFVGVRPIDPSQFETAPPPIETAADRAFARDVNARLQNYLPLWQQLDRLIVLLPEDYHLSQQWRRQAEQQMIASGRSGMSDADIDAFVEYFWRSLHPELFITPLVEDARYVDLVIEINADHLPSAVYRPGDQASRYQG